MASTSRGSSDSGAGSECEGEDQDEPSSPLQEAQQALETLTVNDNEENKENDVELASFRAQWRRELNESASPEKTTAAASPSKSRAEHSSTPSSQISELRGERQTDTPVDEGAEDELSAFRQQWQRELDATPPRQSPAPAPEPEPETDEDKAKQLFLRGVEMERGGKLYEAIQHYKRAMQILPDVETRLYESTDLRADTPQEECEVEELDRVASPHPSDEEDAVEGEDLMARLQRIQARKGRLCDAELPHKGAHISWLPYEVILLILRWVVSADLDAMSLERVATVSRGLYVAARQPHLWRAMCLRTWGIECGTPRSFGYDSWRQMYIERPRLHFHGCYISKTTYLRHGENAYQDTFYRPWYLIDYFRYLRFFPDGVVLMWTTADEPAQCVGQLRSRQGKPSAGILPGHYRLVGDKVVIVVKKCGEKKTQSGGNSRFRARRNQTIEPNDTTFHIELELRSTRRRRNHQLTWARYAVSTRREQWSQFELSPGKFPPFAFSRVRAYTAAANMPLPYSNC